ncbi:ABC transporter permease, partial [Klebsiella pneumoniae]
NMVISKAVSLLIYTVLSMAGFVLLQVIANQIIFGKVELGNAKEFFLYLGEETILHFALVLICI